MPSHNVTLCTLGVGLDEFVQSLSWGLNELGHKVSVRKGTVDPLDINIVFSAFLLKYEELMAAAPRCINYNMEQPSGYIESRTVFGAGSFALMRNVPNWDYSRRNLEVLGAAGVTDVTHVPVGYSPVLECIERASRQDIDVVFYGSRNPRRIKLMQALAARGLKVVWTDNGAWTREQRDGYIARAKVVLNLGFFDDIHILEEIRISYLLANRVAVVSELRADTYAEADMRASVAGGTLEELPELCARLCADAKARGELAERGYETFKARQWLEPLEAALQGYAQANPVRSVASKRDVVAPPRLNIGSGKSWKYEYFNIDIDPQRGADLVFDLNDAFDHDKWHHTWRFGKVKLPRGHFDYILSEHVFEHVRDLIRCMTTCLEWLKDGGVLEVEVPYDLSFGAWQDPTHVRAFNERSWLYYTEWCWYVGWREARFDLISQVHILSELGQKMRDQGADVDTIARTPRAVDALRVKLKKRSLREDEKAAHAQFFRTVS